MLSKAPNGRSFSTPASAPAASVSLTAPIGTSPSYPHPSLLGASDSRTRTIRTPPYSSFQTKRCHYACSTSPGAGWERAGSCHALCPGKERGTGRTGSWRWRGRRGRWKQTWHVRTRDAFETARDEVLKFFVESSLALAVSLHPSFSCLPRWSEIVRRAVPCSHVQELGDWLVE
jgi:hypothetical protein